MNFLAFDETDLELQTEGLRVIRCNSLTITRRFPQGSKHEITGDRRPIRILNEFSIRDVDK